MKSAAVLQFPLALDAGMAARMCPATNDDGLRCAMPRHKTGDHIANGFAWSDAATRRDRGHADALSHYVVEAVRLTITEVAERLTEFTSDDVRDALPAATAESLAAYPNAMGALFRSMAVAHEIEDTGRVVRSRREGARKRKVAVWRRFSFPSP